MLVSIVIPTFNRAATLERALRSIGASPFPLEIIVVDNASTDATSQMLKEWPDQRVRYHRSASNVGMVGNWNQGLSLARGKWVKVLCDDDALVPGALEKELALAESHHGIVLVAGQRWEIAEKDFNRSLEEKRGLARVVGEKRRYTCNGSEALWQMIFAENTIGPPSAALFCREFLAAFPLYNYAADWAAWIVLATKGSVGFLGEPVCCFSLHEGSLTRQFVSDGTELREVLHLRTKAFREWQVLTGRTSIKATVFLFGYTFYRLLRRLFRILRRGELRELYSLARAIKPIRN